MKCRNCKNNTLLDDGVQYGLGQPSWASKEDDLQWRAVDAWNRRC